MRGSKSGVSSSKSIYDSTFEKKYLAMTIFVLSLFIFFSGGFGIVALIVNGFSDIEENGNCGDGTFTNTCSNIQPYFCSQGKLIEFASICGCPEGFILDDNSCSSPYQNGSKIISLKYTLDGESKSLEFIVYDEFSNYIYNLPRSIQSYQELNFSRADFKLMTINQEEQRKFILPLVIKIQNITLDKDDQVRIAISIVQNIPFGSSNKTSLFWGEEINYTRYPYDVLYDLQGVCGEKTDLLSFLLKEMGYGVSLFYYSEENHEAPGISCPFEESLMETGYCFIETTGPSIITDNKISYIGVGKLYSKPEFYILNEGNSLGENFEEYKDADKLIRIRTSMDRRGLIGPFDKNTLKKITSKYGIKEDYYR